MASFLCEDYVQQASSVSEALNHLSKEISSEERQTLEKILLAENLL